MHRYVTACVVRGSGDAEVGMKHTKRCTVQLDNQLKIIYNWVAPEVLFGEQFTFASDIYSLCAVLWEANTGMLVVNTLLHVRGNCRIFEEGVWGTKFFKWVTGAQHLYEVWVLHPKEADEHL